MYTIRCTQEFLDITQREGRRREKWEIETDPARSRSESDQMWYNNSNNSSNGDSSRDPLADLTGNKSGGKEDR